MNGNPKLWPRWLALAAALVFFADRAEADAIDGNWCHADGRTFSIKGPEIITPRGKLLIGNYGRHHYSYTAPEPEPSAGQIIFMTLANENTIYLRIGAADSGAAAEVWNRCGPSVS